MDFDFDENVEGEVVHDELDASFEEETPEVWSITTEFALHKLVENNTATPFIMVNGATIPVVAGANFREVVRNISLDAGFGKFRVFNEAGEIGANNAPEFIAESDRIAIVPFDVPGC